MTPYRYYYYYYSVFQTKSELNDGTKVKPDLASDLAGLWRGGSRDSNGRKKPDDAENDA